MKSFWSCAAIMTMALSACSDEGSEKTGNALDKDTDALASMMYEEGTTDDFEAPEYMLLQLSLDRLGFSPGVIDGRMHERTRNALSAFQEAEGLSPTGQYDAATKQALTDNMVSSATRVVTVPPSWAKARYQGTPDDPKAQSEQDWLGYNSVWERLAERFHTTPEILYGLNPDLCSGSSGELPQSQDTKGEDQSAPQPDDLDEVRPSAAPNAYREMNECAFRGSLADQDLRVPNIVDSDSNNTQNAEKHSWNDTLASLGIGRQQPHAGRVVVDKSDGTLHAFDDQDRLVAAYSVTSGSSRDPLPIGTWKIYGVTKNPDFSYDPKLFWDVPDTNPQLHIPPGPNGPVGVVWIDLSKEHYGIHGTSAPETIGEAQSHGCVRLTNWDAAELAQMVDENTEVLFQE